MQNARDIYEAREQQARRRKTFELVFAVLAAGTLTGMFTVFYTILTR
jgi:hypothetical protein